MRVQQTICLIFILFIPLTLFGQKSSIKLTVDGKELYSLSDAKRIPYGKSVSLTGDIVNNLLPTITLTNIKTAEETKLEVIKSDGGKTWNAYLPQLEPKTQIRLVIHNYESLTEEEQSKVAYVFREMLFTASIQAVNLNPEKYNALQFNEKLTSILKAEFKPDTLLPNYTIPGSDKSNNSIGENLVELVVSIDRDKINFYDSRISAVSNLVQIFNSAEKKTLTLPAEYLNQINSFKNKLKENKLFTSSTNTIRLWLKDAYNGEENFLPIDIKTKNALLAYVKEVTTTPEALKSVETLSLSLEEIYPAVFASIKKIREESFTTETYILPFDVGDLERYGTVDYIQGYIPPLKQTKGFLVFSFYPEGPASRTPEALDELSSWTISLGYGVTGNDDDNEDSYLVGVSHRMNRLLSITGGVVTSNKRKGKWFGFIGITGDLSNLPFLNNIFTTE